MMFKTEAQKGEKYLIPYFTHTHTKKTYAVNIVKSIKLKYN